MRKDIQTYVLGGIQFELTAAGGGVRNADSIFVAQDNLDLIGFELNAYAKAMSELDSGRFEVDVELSKVGQNAQNGCLGHLAAYIWTRSGTVGIGVTETSFGESKRTLVFMFPEGTAVKLNKLDALYINIYWANNMANNHNGSGGARLYFVER